MFTNIRNAIKNAAGKFLDSVEQQWEDATKTPSSETSENNNTQRQQISYGSRGDSVKELQTILNSKGYSLDVDGVFGKKTLAAVRDYQSKNSLAVDGIVGKNTWASFGSSASSSAPSTPSAPSTSTGTSGANNPSSAADQALSALEAQLAAKPAEYRGEWENKLKEQMDRILNREAFSYDLNSDPFYQQYADLFARQGEMAMLDTMGRAQGATGGYGSSYAQSVGQQAYQEHLKGLTDIAPELYSQAYDRYAREGDRLYDEYALMKQEDSEDYARYQDGVARYYDDLDRAYDRYDIERSFDYTKDVDERDFEHQLEREKLADERYEKEYAAATAPTGTSVPGAYKNMSMAEINSLLADANASGDDKLVQAIIDDLEKAGVITGAIADTLYTKYMVGGK